ncbi:hypothetical protein ACIRO3_33935 [Streptomyces sp. NPDC102278]|uniref:hypothetical protein n=1 Tax=Streptomyces sp. NPDC102278 TaxID=3366152 RepID=UPI00382CDC65
MRRIVCAGESTPRLSALSNKPTTNLVGDPGVPRLVLIDSLNGKRYIGTEHFFVARFTDEHPSLVRTGLLPDEQANLDTHVWIAWSDLSSLSDPVEPPRLPAVLGALAPDGPWCSWMTGCHGAAACDGKFDGVTGGRATILSAPRLDFSRS